MSLQEQLTKLKQENLAKFPDEVKNILMSDMKDLSASGIVEPAPKKGDILQGRVVSLL